MLQYTDNLCDVFTHFTGITTGRGKTQNAVNVGI